MLMLSPMVRSYLTTALLHWHHEHKRPEGSFTLSDIVPTSIELAIAECADFADKVEQFCERVEQCDDVQEDSEQLGMIFWMSRAMHYHCVLYPLAVVEIAQSFPKVTLEVYEESLSFSHDENAYSGIDEETEDDFEL